MSPTYLPYVPHAIRENLVCVALAHRILRGGDGTEANRLVLSRRLQHHRGTTIRLLVDYLDKSGTKHHEGILSAVLSFLLAEVRICDVETGPGAPNLLTKHALLDPAVGLS